MKNKFHDLKNSSKAYKNLYGAEYFKLLCDELGFDNKSSLLSEFRKKHLELELKDRLHLIADILDRELPRSYPSKLAKLKTLLGPEYPMETGMLNHGYYLYPVSQFVENNALLNVHSSFSFIYELTKRFTGEFAVRPLVSHDKKRALTTMKKWSKDPNFHVRRLASEGLRVRLPWGQGVEWIRKNPADTISVFSSLRNDPVLYVRRSVANAIGDIIKIDEDLGVEIMKKWLDDSPSLEVLWICKHAIRHPLKKSNQRFLRLKRRLETLY